MDKSRAGEMTSCNTPCLSEGKACMMWGGTERLNQRCKVKMDEGGELESRENDRGGGHVGVFVVEQLRD